MIMKNITVGQSLPNYFPFSLANKITYSIEKIHMDYMNTILCLHSESGIIT
jgi:hypothetical protein